ncbi:MAG: hypothetical protein HY700_21905 [Gemmatimonadetes bacterium]|nr:hypothetical protein [Gemmatimonadota bacterium]
MAKTLDPVWASERKPQHPYWSRAFDALDRALKLQLIVCPVSRIHEKESVLVARHFPVLRRLYEHLAGGATFEFPTHVEAMQLYRAFRARLAGTAVDYAGITAEDVIRAQHDTIHGWSERIMISVNWPAANPDPAAVRLERSRSAASFREMFSRWTQEGRSFEEVYDSERTGEIQAMLQLWREHVAAKLRAEQTGEFSDELWNYRLEVQTVYGLLSVANELGLDATAAVSAVAEFLTSEDALTGPANEISALMMAGLARRAASGQKRPPSPGMWNDIKAISNYLPYCDAVFVDDECASLLREVPLRDRIQYPTRVFSSRTREAFIDYLVGLERDAGDAHRDLITSVYGETWLEPYRTILKHERERVARREAETASGKRES